MEINNAAKLVERGDALEDLHGAVLRHAAYLLVPCRSPDVALARRFTYARFDLLIHEDDLDDRYAALVAQASAFLAPFCDPHLLAILRKVFRMRNAFEKWLHDFYLFGRHHFRFATVRAQSTHEALCHRGSNRGAEDVGINAHVNKPRESTGGVVRVKC